MTFCVAALLLAACDGNTGGDGTNENPEPRDIFYPGDMNSLQISRDQVGALAGTGSGSAEAFLGVQNDLPTVSAADAMMAQANYKTALAKLNETRAQLGTSVGGVVVGEGSRTNQCAGGGSVTVSWNRASEVCASNGDWVKATYDACVDAGGGLTTGSIRIDITGTDCADPSDPQATLADGVPYGMKLTVTDFYAEDSSGFWFGMEGDMAFTIVWNGADYPLGLWSSISGSSFVSAFGEAGLGVLGAAALYPPPGADKFTMETIATVLQDETTLYSEQSGVNAKLCSTQIGGCVNFETDPLFLVLAVDEYPDAGTFRISDDFGSWIELFVEPGTGAGTSGVVTVRWQVPGSTGSATTTWTCLDTDGCFAP